MAAENNLNHFCERVRTVEGEFKILTQRADNQDKRMDSIERKIEAHGEELKECIDIHEHQRTVSKMDKIFDIVLSIKDSNAEMQQVFTNAINDVKISTVKIDVKVLSIVALIGFISSIVGALIVIFISQYIK